MNIPLTEIVARFSQDTKNVLDCIQANPGLSHGDLRAKLNYTQSRMEKELSKLEGSLLIKTNRNPEDKRLTIYTITDYGKEAIKLF